jgi:hypothetical protein
MSYRDELEAARRRIAALEADLRSLAPVERDPRKPIELEVAHLRRVLEETRLVLDQERARRASSERAIGEIPFLRRRLQDDEQLIDRLRVQVERHYREAKITEPRLRELDALRHQAKSSEERAERAEREVFRLRMRLALERVRDVVPPEVGADLSRGIDAIAKRFGPDVWDVIDPDEVDLRLKQLVVFASHAVWPAKSGAKPDPDSIVSVLEEIGHRLPPIDPWSWGPERVEMPGLRIRIRSIDLRAVVKLERGALHVATLEADSGLSVAVLDR